LRLCKQEQHFIHTHSQLNLASLLGR